MNILSLNIRGIKGGDKAKWVKELRLKNGANLIALQESLQAEVSERGMVNYWGNKNFKLDFVGAVGHSGGLICMWDPSMLEVSDSLKNRNFLCISGKLKGRGEKINYINVYAPQGVSAKRRLWHDLAILVDSLEGLILLVGDFNAVRTADERKNSIFKPVCARNFNEFIYKCGLLEYSMQGRRFTCVRNNGKKLSKIDRVLVSAEFFNKWPDACLRAHPCLLSDHCPLSLSVANNNFGPRPFRVFSSWIGKPGFDEAVRSASASSSGIVPPDIAITKKFARIRAALKDWRDKFLEKEGEEEAETRLELERLEEELEIRDLSEEEEWTMSECKKVIKDIGDRKNFDLKQRSRVRWAIDGDENSKFFHALINNRRASNSIPGLLIDGEWCSKPSKIKKEVFGFFRDKFKERIGSRPALFCDNFKKLSESSIDLLVSEFSKEEIKSAVFECGDERAPGPDGLNFKFIKHFWPLFEEDFENVFREFFFSGRLNCGSGSSFISLVPKVKDPVSLNNFRPINLVGVLSKTISKVLTNRMRKVLHEVISDSQSAFITGKHILDGPLIVNEIINWLKKKKSRAFILKIDFEKAYDNVNWDFVESSLSQMGFPQRWCVWVRGILRSARSSVLVNGAPTFEFQCSKGMRQGDPLSPFLFLTVMEALSCMIEKAYGAGVIKGIRLPNKGPVVSHLLYADDAVILGEWEKEEVLNVVRILRCFHLCSGLKINIAKSNLYGIGVDLADTEALARMVGCKPDAPPFKYLGLMVGANMNRINNWKPVYDIFESRLSVWKASLLSIGGRVTIIKSVLESLPNYYFSIYKAPIKVINDLESLIKSFLWGGSGQAKKVHWVAWDRVALP
ncbi:hypothetical protein L1987_37001 [Smallanthus sonchifolius]|uniref:Uncharacterized protein n=1 Tax=Smallanthus sonchifolius TaxID=185202 RepID=A0ACB9HGD6_9ASTR|nr:hypothetical protein L1987_37001 [Smallanthus sonchifolius]